MTARDDALGHVEQARQKRGDAAGTVMSVINGIEASAARVAATGLTGLAQALHAAVHVLRGEVVPHVVAADDRLQKTREGILAAGVAHDHSYCASMLSQAQEHCDQTHGLITAATRGLDQAIGLLTKVGVKAAGRVSQLQQAKSHLGDAAGRARLVRDTAEKIKGILVGDPDFR